MGAFYSGLANGSYTFTVSLTLTDGGSASATRQFAVGEALPVTAGPIAAGFEHTCALTSGGGVKCWGDNSLGQLGNGTNTDSNVPVDIVL